MIKKSSILITLFLLLCSFSFSDYFSKKTYSYQNKKNNKITKTNITFSTKDDLILILKTSSKEETSIKYQKDYELLSYINKIENENTLFNLIRKNNNLICQGRIRNNKLYSSYRLGRNNWVQDFNFGFTSFLQSKKNIYKFIMINPNDFTKNEMIATKQNIETININNEKYSSQKIKVTLRGFRSHFWKAEIWFDTKTNNLLKYVSNEGPGTANIVTTLINFK
ncbi:MAG: hypothetical protein K1060chlam5_00191 [Candidatus Anoxychlamydiales bacterium]|nr:hypothetical protein [Candidatus Anoxychlamydiales bacterium]